MGIISSIKRDASSFKELFGAIMFYIMRPSNSGKIAFCIEKKE